MFGFVRGFISFSFANMMIFNHVSISMFIEPYSHIEYLLNVTSYILIYFGK